MTRRRKVAKVCQTLLGGVACGGGRAAPRLGLCRVQTADAAD